EITPVDAFNELAAWYSRSGATNEDWKRVLEGGYAGATVPSLTARDGKPSQELVAAYEMFRQLRAKAPNILD
ncbi:hypothetical protein, partial [Raoultella ornithinolytica]|uniref:hypothetical protein n=1 Tax=Raoultella ornithinolytica TaxID=54291 RepID=UPI0019540CBA